LNDIQHIKYGCHSGHPYENEQLRKNDLKAKLEKIKFDEKKNMIILRLNCNIL